MDSHAVGHGQPSETPAYKCRLDHKAEVVAFEGDPDAALRDWLGESSSPEPGPIPIGVVL
jgi:hypothetical protein